MHSYCLYFVCAVPTSRGPIYAPDAMVGYALLYLTSLCISVPVCLSVCLFGPLKQHLLGCLHCVNDEVEMAVQGLLWVLEARVYHNWILNCCWGGTSASVYLGMLKIIMILHWNKRATFKIVITVESRSIVFEGDGENKRWMRKNDQSKYVVLSSSKVS